MSMLSLEHVTKQYQVGEVFIKAVEDIGFSIEEGEFVVVLGASGAGKTTVLNILGGMDRASGGHIWVNGEDITAYNDRQLTTYRREKIGFVFQFYNLIPNLTALENVEFATDVCPHHLNPIEVLAEVGLRERANNFPAQLSGGEQQRVAIARAVAKNPLLLLCDEPTVALDYVTGKMVLKLLEEVNRSYNKTVILITHNSMIAPMADKIVRIKSGKVQSVIVNEERRSVDEIEW